MKRSFCRALCALLGCALLLSISACAKADRIDSASSEPPVETQQTEATAETEGEKGQGQPLSEEETTYRKNETYHFKETSTHDNIEEIVDNVFRSDDDSFVKGTYERHYRERYTVKGTRVANGDGTFTQTGTIRDEDGHLESSWELVYADENASNAPRNADMIIQQDAYGNIVSVCGSNETQNEDINPEYFTENWKDNRKPYNTHQVEDRNVNMISFRDLMNLHDGNGELIRVFDDSFIWNDDGSITSTNSAEYFQDYEDYLKGYKVNQITKTRADGTTSESIGDFTEPDGINTKEHYIRNEDGTGEDYVEKWKDGRKQYDGHWLYDQNENPISMQEVIYHYDDDGALIRILENEFIWNDDGGTTLINAVEFFQDYEGSLKGYKAKQIKKDRADGTTYELHGEYWYPDGRYSKAGFTTNANGARENYSEEWKDGKKVSQ